MRREFRDRVEAGDELAPLVVALGLADPVVLGLPRGGVPVAARLALALGAPLDVIVVRKVGVPSQPELAMGAVGEGGATVVNDDVMMSTWVSRADFERVAARERAELERRVVALRAVRPREPLAGRAAVLVDDGIATGATMRAAIGVARANDASTVVIATPVAPPEVVQSLSREADEVVCIIQPEPFFAVGTWYTRFEAVPEEEVLHLLA